MERLFLLTPLREGRRGKSLLSHIPSIFLLTPLREGRRHVVCVEDGTYFISTHAPAGGATCKARLRRAGASYFYSRPCGRGDVGRLSLDEAWRIFLLTPLREGRPSCALSVGKPSSFLLTPLREGRPFAPPNAARSKQHFYSRPCGRGDLFPAYGRSG